jgi:hypothetical protein
MGRVVLMTISGSIGGMAVGYNIGVAAPTLLFFENVFTTLDITD